jgi:hypothetical protein
VAESARLLNGYTPKGYRGFESHPLRHFNAEKPPQTDFACVCVSKCVCGRGQGGRENRDYPRCGMTDALAGIAKKQDAEAISRRIHEKGSVYVFEKRRMNRVP